MDVDLDKEVMAIAENHPYLALVVGGPSAEVFFVVERCVFESLSKVSSIMVVLIAGYFTFNMAYPKSLYPVCTFLQHFMLGIKDKQVVPNIVTRLLSSLDKIEL